MDRSSTFFITILYLMGVWLSCHPVYGKCRGDWKSYHGCLGGNGKRSDPAVEMGDGGSRLLQRLLVGDLPAFSDDNEVDRDPRAHNSLSGQPNKRTEYASTSDSSLENLLREVEARLSNRYNDK